MKQWILNEIKKLKFAYIHESIAAPVKSTNLYGQWIPTKRDLQTAFVANMRTLINVALMKDPLTLSVEKDKTDQKFNDLMKSLDAFDEADSNESELDNEINNS